MNGLKIDKEAALRMAEELGLQVFFDSPITGVKFKDELVDFDSFFPELSSLDSDETIQKDVKLIAKDSEVFENLCSPIMVAKKASVTIKVTQDQNFSTEDNSDQAA